MRNTMLYLLEWVWNLVASDVVVNDTVCNIQFFLWKTDKITLTKICVRMTILNEFEALSLSVNLEAYKPY